MCNNPMAHPELTGGEPVGRRGLSQGTTLCGKHNPAHPTLEDYLESIGLPTPSPAVRQRATGPGLSRTCADCAHILSRLN